MSTNKRKRTKSRDLNTSEPPTKKRKLSTLSDDNILSDNNALSHKNSEKNPDKDAHSKCTQLHSQNEYNTNNIKADINKCNDKIGLNIVKRKRNKRDINKENNNELNDIIERANIGYESSDDDCARYYMDNSDDGCRSRTVSITPKYSDASDGSDIESSCDDNNGYINRESFSLMNIGLLIPVFNQFCDINRSSYAFGINYTNSEEFVIGNGHDKINTDLIIDDRKISRKHGMIVSQPNVGEIKYIDCSSNGTYINKVKYKSKEVSLKDGYQLSFLIGSGNGKCFDNYMFFLMNNINGNDSNNLLSFMKIIDTDATISLIINNSIENISFDYIKKYNKKLKEFKRILKHNNRILLPLNKIIFEYLYSLSFNDWINDVKVILKYHINRDQINMINHKNKHLRRSHCWIGPF